jgi:Domain of unknown function (DUF1707)
MGDVDDGQPEIRIGDRERREVDARLQQAHADGVLTLTEYDERAAQCWAARTRTDLDPLTRDLPPAQPAPAAVDAAPVPPPAPTKSLAERAIGGLVTAALIGAGVYLGGQALWADDGASVFGSREVQIAGTQDRVEVGTLFGKITVRVPDDVRVRTTGTLVFGSVKCAAACQGTPNQREVVVDAGGAFGSVQVLRQNEQPRDDQDK